MTFNDFKAMNYDCVKAYLLGLMYPKFNNNKGNSFNDGKYYVLGVVNHNAKYITQDEVAAHLMAVRTFLTDNNYNPNDFTILPSDSRLGRIKGTQVGFAFFFETESNTEAQCVEYLRTQVNELETKDDNIKRYFIKGMFDGRGSCDQNSKLLVVDVDSTPGKMETLDNIVRSMGFQTSNNTRHTGEARPMQFRIKGISIRKWKNEIDFFSVRRKNELQKIINNL